MQIKNADIQILATVKLQWFVLMKPPLGKTYSTGSNIAETYIIFLESLLRDRYEFTSLEIKGWVGMSRILYTDSLC